MKMFQIGGRVFFRSKEYQCLPPALFWVGLVEAISDGWCRVRLDNDGDRWVRFEDIKVLVDDAQLPYLLLSWE